MKRFLQMVGVAVCLLAGATLTAALTQWLETFFVGKLAMVTFGIVAVAWISWIVTQQEPSHD